MTKETFLLLTPDELVQIAKDCKGVEGEHFLPHLYGNAVQMAVLKKNGIGPETLKHHKENDWQKVPENWQPTRTVPTTQHHK